MRDRLLGERLSFGVGCFFFFVSLGTSVQVFATDTGIPTPFTLMRHLPVLEHLRTPIRFAFVAMFFWMIPGAAGFHWLIQAARKLPHAAFVTTVAVLIGLVLVDSYTYYDDFIKPPPDISVLESIEEGAVMNLPLDLYCGETLFAQTIHHQPIGTGFTSRPTDDQVRLLTFLEHSLWFDLEALAEYLDEYGFRTFLITSPIPAILRARISELPLTIVDWGHAGGERIVASVGRIEGVGLARTAWTEDDRIGSEGRRAQLPDSLRVRQVDLLADGEASFRVTAFNGGEVVAEVSSPGSSFAGLRWRAVALGETEIDGVVVMPEPADSDTALRAIVLVD